MTIKPEPTHIEWQEQVTQLLALHGWSWLHVRRTIGRGKQWVTATNITGWPDLLAFHPTRGGVLALELKVGKDTLKPEQKRCLADLRMSGIPAFVAYPCDLPSLRYWVDELRGSAGPLGADLMTDDYHFPE